MLVLDKFAECAGANELLIKVSKTWESFSIGGGAGAWLIFMTSALLSHWLFGFPENSSAFSWTLQSGKLIPNLWFSNPDPAVWPWQRFKQASRLTAVDFGVLPRARSRAPIVRLTPSSLSFHQTSPVFVWRDVRVTDLNHGDISFKVQLVVVYFLTELMNFLYAGIFMGV